MNLFGDVILEKARSLFSELWVLDDEARIETINAIRQELHNYSPFREEPVDCVQWISAEKIQANDYNPNSVAPPEMRLLEHSITEDGYTQPIVAWQNNGHFEVIDGFHRNRVGRESKKVRDRVMGYLPLTIVNASRVDRGDRIAATIRHNRARGKHQVEAMSDIVVELKRRNWSEDRIERELGMEKDEVLRLCQITGLAELFTDQEFSKSWDVEGQVDESDFQELTDDISTYGEETEKFRTVNTSDESRIFHTHDKWECHKAGFYNGFPPEGMTKESCEISYRDFLADIPRFSEALERVTTEWKHSCEHYLTNVAMNRIAWLGQASCCYAMGIPSVFRSGFGLLSEAQQAAANEAALLYLLLRNAVTNYEPRWTCWDESKRDLWIRQKPEGCKVESDYPFCIPEMEFEEFIVLFGEWYGQGQNTAGFIGIRAQESLHRYCAVATWEKRELTFKGHRWTTKIVDNCYNIYPIYDWTTEDIWRYHAKHPEKPHNRIYDKMHMAGVKLSQQRLCQPFGDDQRRGLWLYHILEPQTWFKLIARVNGANSGALYIEEKGNINGYNKVALPPGHTWKSFCNLLLQTMPKKTRDHYMVRFKKFIYGWNNRGYTAIPDESPPELEAKCWAPSWRRMCRVLLRNDWWCKGLGMAQPKSAAWQKFKEMKHGRLDNEKRQQPRSRSKEVENLHSGIGGSVPQP